VLPRPQIVEVVSPERERLDACMVFPSMPAVMKMNKLGTFSMSQLGQVWKQHALQLICRLLLVKHSDCLTMN